MKYLVQIDGTNPKNWRTINATNKEAAVFQAVKPLIQDGHNPDIAYVVLGEACHPDGAPFCVQSYKLNINRKSNPLDGETSGFPASEMDY